MDIVPFLQSGVLDGCKVASKHYLKTVKSMDYDEFCDAIACVIPDLSVSLPLFHCDEWYEFVVFTYDGNAPIDVQVSDEEYVVRDCKKEYPVTLIQTGPQQWRLEGIAPHCLMKCHGVMNLPLVIETIGSSADDAYHQTVLVLDFRQQHKTNTNKTIAFLYDPNGASSRFDTPDVHRAIHAYVDLINVELTETTQLQYQRLSNQRMNFHLKYVGGGNCVVCSILFMISYSLLDMDIIQYDAILQGSKSLLTKLHILLYNAIGFELQRFVRY